MDRTWQPICCAGACGGVVVDGVIVREGIIFCICNGGGATGSITCTGGNGGLLLVVPPHPTKEVQGSVTPAAMVLPWAKLQPLLPHVAGRHSGLTPTLAAALCDDINVLRIRTTAIMTIIHSMIIPPS
jgi:hypothetical protein